MLIEQPPTLLRKLYPGALWRMNPDERAVYLTFDDGPIPEVTPWVLGLLEQYGVKATFFMVGDNIRAPRRVPPSGGTGAPHRQPHVQPHPRI